MGKRWYDGGKKKEKNIYVQDTFSVQKYVEPGKETTINPKTCYKKKIK